MADMTSLPSRLRALAQADAGNAGVLEEAAAWIEGQAEVEIPSWIVMGALCRIIGDIATTDRLGLTGLDIQLMADNLGGHGVTLDRTARLHLLATTPKASW